MRGLASADAEVAVGDGEPVLAPFYRDAKILEVGEGTSEAQRMIIARELGLDA